MKNAKGQCHAKYLAKHKSGLWLLKTENIPLTTVSIRIIRLILISNESIFTLRCLKRDPGLSFGTFQAGCIGLYWAGYVGVKVPNERHGSLFKHQRVLHKKYCLHFKVLTMPWKQLVAPYFALIEHSVGYHSQWRKSFVFTIQEVILPSHKIECCIRLLFYY